MLLALAGCVSVPIARFETATRIDGQINPSPSPGDGPFAAQLRRLKHQPARVCDDPATVQRIYTEIAAYEGGWTDLWAMPPPAAPVTLTFHCGDEWLGTLDLYPSQLGHVGNKTHPLPRDKAARILELLVNCAQWSADADSAPNAPAEAPR